MATTLPAYKPAQKKRAGGPLRNISEMLLPSFPDLKKKLVLAGKEQMEPSDFMEKVIFSTLFMSIGLLFVSFLFLDASNAPKIYLVPLALVFPVVLFYYFMLYPDVAILKRKRAIESEIVFGGRHLVIALKSGMPLFSALVGASRGYGAVSEEFNKIVEKVSLGVPLSVALREAAQTNPSGAFVRICTQLANSLASGSDVASALDSVLDQVATEQMIELKEYGQKLTPMVMFFMIFGIILPSIGVAFMIILFSLLSGLAGIGSNLLLLVFFFILIVQFLFLAMMENSRPRFQF